MPSSIGNHMMDLQEQAKQPPPYRLWSTGIALKPANQVHNSCVGKPQKPFCTLLALQQLLGTHHVVPSTVMQARIGLSVRPHATECVARSLQRTHSMGTVVGVWLFLWYLWSQEAILRGGARTRLRGFEPQEINVCTLVCMCVPLRAYVCPCVSLSIGE